MALVLFQTTSEMRGALVSRMQKLSEALAQLDQVCRLERAQRGVYAPGTIHDSAAAYLAAIQDNITEEEALTIDDEFIDIIRVGCIAGFTGVTVDAVYNTTKSSLTAVGASPFGKIVADDWIELTNCTKPGNDGQYKVESCSGIVIVLTSNLSENTTGDTTMVIRRIGHDA